MRFPRGAVVVALTLGIASPSSAASQRPVPEQIGGISFQRAFAGSRQGKSALVRLTSFQEQKRREIERRHKDLAALERAFQRSLGALTPKSREERSRALDKFRLDTERFIQDAQNEFLGVQRDVENAFRATLRPVLEQVLKDYDIQILLNLDDKERVLIADPAIDLTAEVLARLERLNP
jgi:Skp family chaperone for outer membrane proteins